MAIEVLGIHHHATRIDADKAAAVQNFYKDVLGLGADPGRPTIPGVPGFWINVGNGGQIHLIGGAQPSTLAKGPGQDPTIPHVALAVADIQATKAELHRLGVKYWSMTGINGPRGRTGLHQRPQRQHGRAASGRPVPLRRRGAGGIVGYFSSSFAPGGVGTSKTLSVTEMNELALTFPTVAKRHCLDRAQVRAVLLFLWRGGQLKFRHILE